MAPSGTVSVCHPGSVSLAGIEKKVFFFCKRVFANFQTPYWHGRICLLRGRVLAGQKNCPAALHRKKSFFFFANAFLQIFKLRSGTAGFASSGAASWRSQKTSLPPCTLFFDVFLVASSKRFFDCTVIFCGCSGCSGSAEVSQIVCEARHGALKCRK